MTPGCLYDLTLRGTDNDQLTIFSPSKQQGRVSYVKMGEDQQSVVTHVSSALTGGLTKTHIYFLEKDEYGITITLTLLNGTEEKISGPINDSWTRFRNLANLIQLNGPMQWTLLINVVMHTWLPDEDGKLPPKNQNISTGHRSGDSPFLKCGNISCTGLWKSDG